MDVFSSPVLFLLKLIKSFDGGEKQLTRSSSSNPKYFTLSAIDILVGWKWRSIYAWIPLQDTQNVVYNSRDIIVWKWRSIYAWIPLQDTQNVVYNSRDIIVWENLTPPKENILDPQSVEWVWSQIMKFMSPQHKIFPWSFSWHLQYKHITMQQCNNFDFVCNYLYRRFLPGEVVMETSELSVIITWQAISMFVCINCLVKKCEMYS